jgi:alkylresorcinol/alkylpyrone synthase
VIRAVQDVLDLDDADLELTRQSLNTIGNVSSASVLFVLRDTLLRRPAEPGQWGVLTALGPGFSAELVLLKW